MTWVTDPDSTPTHTPVGGRQVGGARAQRKAARELLPPRARAASPNRPRRRGAASFQHSHPSRSLSDAGPGKEAAPAASKSPPTCAPAPTTSLSAARRDPSLPGSRRGADKAATGVPLRSEWLGLRRRGFAPGSPMRRCGWRDSDLADLETPAGRQPLPLPPGSRKTAAAKAVLPPGTRSKTARPIGQCCRPAARRRTFSRRYVYLFALDSSGGSSLLVPGPGMLAGRNLVPDAPATVNAGQSLIPLGQGFLR